MMSDDAGTPIVRDVEIGPEDSKLAAGTIEVYVEAKCPNCKCRLASYRKYVESSKAYIGAIVTISFTGSCYNKGECGSGKFDWRGTVTDGVVYKVVD
jgi:hypothetical protein